MSNELNRWCVADDADAEILYCGSPTRDETIAKGRARYPGKAFFLFECRRPSVDELFEGAAEHLLESVENSAAETYGECSEGFPDATGEDRLELQARIIAWAKERNIVASFWSSHGCPEAERIEPEGATT